MAAVKIVRPRVSYADLERAPEDGRRYELYDGEVFVVPAPVPRHQVVQLLIAEALHRHASAHGGFSVGSPIDIVFSDTTSCSRTSCCSRPSGPTWWTWIA